MYENDIEKENSFATNLNMISNKLKSGLTQQELELQKDLPISPDWKVKDLIEANLRTGFVKYSGVKFVTTQAIINIRLTIDEEDILNQKAVEAGLSVEELVEDFVLRGLANQ